jgi:hypothetical protein
MKLAEDDKLKAVITTKYVMKNGSPVTEVYYDDDGDWQFFGTEECGEDDAVVISVQQIIDSDSTLADLPDLKKGQKACRTGKNADWEIASM